MWFRGLILCLALLAALPAMAAKRALIVGNDTYEHLTPLLKAREDAQGYAAYFRDQGFEVTSLTDMRRRDMIVALANFYDSIRPTDTVAFVFSGHGWSDGRQNYLLPTDMVIDGSQTLIEQESIPLRNGVNGIIDQIAARKPALTIAIIDACRDNPFRAGGNTRSIGLSRGLAPVTAPIGTFIAFSAGENQTALDRLTDDDPEPYSVFTRFFLSELRQTVDIQAAFKATQVAVNTAAQQIGHPQRPAYYDEVIGRACLTQSCAPVNPMPVAAPADPVVDPATRAAEEWEAFRETRSIKALELFRDRHAGTAHAALAQERIEILRASTEPAPEQARTPAPAPTPVPEPRQIRPSFDCVLAQSASELAICASADLAGADRRMADLYFARKARLSGGAADALVQEQRKWLGARETCGSDEACLMSLYQQRISQLLN